MPALLCLDDRPPKHAKSTKSTRQFHGSTGGIVSWLDMSGARDVKSVKIGERHVDAKSVARCKGQTIPLRAPACGCSPLPRPTKIMFAKQPSAPTCYPKLPYTPPHLLPTSATASYLDGHAYAFHLNALVLLVGRLCACRRSAIFPLATSLLEYTKLFPSISTITSCTMGGGLHEPTRHRYPHLVIIVPFSEPKPLIASLRLAHPHTHITFFDETSHPTIPPCLFESATALCTFSSLPHNPRLEAPHLEWVHFLSAGVDWISEHPIYKDTPNVLLTTSRGVHGPQVAEWALMTRLVHSHQYDVLHDLQSQHRWLSDGDDSPNLTSVSDSVGKRIGILGYGSIGRQVGRLARAMGMHVIAYTSSERKSKDERRDIGYIVPGTGDPNGAYPLEWYSGTDRLSLHRFLGAQLDWLVVCVPLTPQTQHMLGSDEFQVLSRRCAFISNIARGSVIRQDDLIAALRQGLLQGAALDVTDPEPLPKESPLWDMANVTVTPHVSGKGSAYLSRALDILHLNLLRHERHERLINLVDRKKGY
ncbi:hypothetical protein FH972_026028 [Carpinus fangiana]|uniref:D-isomer specific 2-hydroxyacid dehydrogenase NAD-binding domain-containing protein n=1 Tax=Carpinus fangiana TaxID=176857 RepID=A0A5N6L2R3_9ROSI|nr:hypothetical protein FH972_026028 [Carpinus fangiana]